MRDNAHKYGCDPERLVLSGESAGGNLEDLPERVDSVSPLNCVHKDLPPTLIIHGKNDSLVPIDGSRKYVEAAKKL